MYSQFCYHFQKFAEQECATMHIPRKPGDRIEITLGERTVAVEVVQVADNVRKDDAAGMYKEV